MIHSAEKGGDDYGCHMEHGRMCFDQESKGSRGPWRDFRVFDEQIEA